jgi:hypothetical protein
MNFCRNNACRKPINNNEDFCFDCEVEIAEERFKLMEFEKKLKEMEVKN